MKRAWATIALGALLTGTILAQGAAGMPGRTGRHLPGAAEKAIAAALADPRRPAADVARDPARKPAELLTFAGVKPGSKVLDFIMGGGYITRILAGTVGKAGHVYAYQPDEFIKFKAQYGLDQKAVVTDYPDVAPINGPFGTLALPGDLDTIITVQNYHDLHLGVFPADTAEKVNAALFAALKHGGTLVIVDHVAATGSGLAAPDKFHRIDPAIVKSEVEKAGFRFDAKSFMFRNASDPHSASVFDPAIRGKTDQFVYRFRKP